jgi:3-dehydroquinate dehydratase-2
MEILIIHGPNLNQLEKRDPVLYGNLSQDQLLEMISNRFEDVFFTLYQSNYEGDIIEILHNSESYDGMILNLGAFTHYSYAIRDALEIAKKPSCDVHLSDLSKRESFRQVNVLEGLTLKTCMGNKEKSYFEAIEFLIAHIS